MPNNNLDKVIAKYQVAVNKNTSESEILWSRFSSMLIFNSILITALGIAFQSSTKLPFLIITYLPIAGLISCYLWFISSLRGFQWIKFWATKARKIEEKYLVDQNHELNPILDGNEHRSNVIGQPGVETATYFLIFMIGIFYIIFLISILNVGVSNKIHYNQQKIILNQYK